jgi:DNA-binding LacI/PurR family transcriptional regulator
MKKYSKLLVLLLSLALVIGALVIVSSAEENVGMVAETGGAAYATVKEAILAAEDGATVKIEVLPFNNCHKKSELAMRELLTRILPGTDAVFCLTDLTALNMLECAKTLAIDVPGSLGIMGFDNIYASEHVTPRLTTIAQPNGKVIKKALELALEIYNAPEASLPQSVKFPGTLVHGQTTDLSGKLPQDHLPGK